MRVSDRTITWDFVLWKQKFMYYIKFWIWFWTFPIWTCNKFDQNLFCHIISIICTTDYMARYFFKVYDTGFVFIFWLFEWKVCLMYNSQDSYIYIVIFQNYICPLSMLSHDQTFFDKAALCHLYDHIVSEFLLVCNVYEWQEMKCYI